MEYSSNCWFFQPEHDRKHPAPFPTELVYRLIRLYSWENDTILDPYVGSCTTCRVATDLNRNYIGIYIYIGKTC